MGTKTKNTYSVSEFIKKVKNTSSINKKYVINVLNNTSRDQANADQYHADINKMVSCVSLIKDKARARVAFTIYEYFVKNNISIDDDLLKMLVGNFCMSGIYFSQAIEMTYVEVKSKLKDKNFQGKNSKFERVIESTHLERGLTLDTKKKVYDNMLSSLSKKKKTFQIRDLNVNTYVSGGKRICIYYLMRCLLVEDAEYAANTTIQYLGDKLWFDCLSTFHAEAYKCLSDGNRPSDCIRGTNVHLNYQPPRPLNKMTFFHFYGPNEDYYMESIFSSICDTTVNQINDMFVDVMGCKCFSVAWGDSKTPKVDIDQFISFSQLDVRLSNSIIKSFFDMLLGASRIVIHANRPVDDFSDDENKTYSEKIKKLDQLKMLINQNRSVLSLLFYFSSAIALRSTIPNKINLSSDKNIVEGSTATVELCLNRGNEQLTIVNK